MTDNNEDQIKFCPRCSAPARVAEGKMIVCAACGFTLYFNTAAAVAALIFDDAGRLMFIRRNHDPRRGYLDLPGGFVDYGEDGEAAVRREVMEELGIEIEDVRYYRSIPNNYPYKGILYRTLDLFFTCRAGDLSAAKYNDEVSEILLCRPHDIVPDEIAFDSIKKLISGMTA